MRIDVAKTCRETVIKWENMSVQDSANSIRQVWTRNDTTGAREPKIFEQKSEFETFRQGVGYEKKKKSIHTIQFEPPPCLSHKIHNHRI